jgi:hypothetical protein
MNKIKHIQSIFQVMNLKKMQNSMNKTEISRNSISNYTNTEKEKKNYEQTQKDHCLKFHIKRA